MDIPFRVLILISSRVAIEATQRFDPSSNVKFITYAVWWIRQAMMHALSDQARAFCFPPKLFSTLRAGVDDVSLNAPVGAHGRGDDDRRELGDVLVQQHVAPIDDAMIHQA